MLRSLDTADVLSEKFCDDYLDSLRPQGLKFQYRPEALCVGRNNSMKYKVFYTEDSKQREKNMDWKELDSKFLKKNSEIIREIYSKNMIDMDRDEVFVSSAGSCSGDSGGPVFVKSNKNPPLDHISPPFITNC